MAWAKASLTFAPRLLPTPQAAAYLGVSPTKMLALPIRPKQLDGKVVYDRLDLDAYADTLLYQGEQPRDEGRNSCDEAFGT
jgi:hypothetical protein